MAERKRMTCEQVVGYLLEGEGMDFLRESLSWVVQQLMEAEVSELVGVARGERAPEERLTHRNGYRARLWATRAGELELAIPKLRRGSYFPSFLEPRRRSEQALVSVVREAYVAGVSTRKVDQVVESLGLRICNPVEKVSEAGRFRIEERAVHLTCYEIFGPQRTEATTFGVFNQFETDLFTVTSYQLLCVPSAKLGFAPVG
jgi:Transposase, Mutator family